MRLLRARRIICVGTTSLTLIVGTMVAIVVYRGVDMVVQTARNTGRSQTSGNKFDLLEDLDQGGVELMTGKVRKLIEDF